MHEMSLCEGLLNLVEDQARQKGFSRVHRLRLEIGGFSCIEEAALRFAFDAVTRGTLAEGATLDLVVRPGRALCFDCGHEVTLADRMDPCPECGGGVLMPVGGDDLRVRDIEVD